MSRHPSSSSGLPEISRRTFVVTGLAALALAGATPFIRPPDRRRFKGSIAGAGSRLGHALRDGKFPPPSESAEAGIAVVGGGIAGLAAARRLQQSGFKDFQLLELEAAPGGTAASGRNEVSAFPWGAAYVPIAGSEDVEVTRLFEELGVIEGRDAAGLPVYREEHLCADPMERLHIHGRWQEGFVPQFGNTVAEQRAMESFLAEMHRLQSVRGSDGRRAFAIPIDESSGDEAFTKLDRITMADYLRDHGWLGAAPLRWYVDYCCRDDYGAGLDQVSAWAGVHYFASRDGRAANAPGYAVLTWPEGNGWLVRQMQAPMAAQIRSSCAVWNVEPEAGGVRVDYYDDARQKSVRLRVRGVVWAAPQFVARRVIRPFREQSPSEPVYSPWLVANLTLDALPGGRDAEVAWDNVLYSSRSLGYVVATHQNLQPVPGATVITYFRPLDEGEPAAVRQRALTCSYDDWCDLILEDLGVAHPGIADQVRQLDVWLWGHAMVRPVPGFIWGAARERMQQPLGNIVFAHSDLSGVAIFEEAYNRGVRAAAALLQKLESSVRKS